MMPTNTLPGTEQSLSGESSVDGNTYERGNEEEGSSHGGSQDDVDSPHKEKKVDRQYTLERKSKSMPIDIQRDVEILGEQSKENDVENVQFLSDREDDNDEMDAPIWEPPEPENLEDEVEGGLANVEDDEDCCDSSKWSKSSSLGDSKGESSKKRHRNEEIQRAMLEEAESKFKFIVCQLVKSARFPSEEGQNWIEIVGKLCWEAASLLKPFINGKPVDPSDYIKVKCIATGSCNESEIFKGLVFKKHAAHKNMATKYEHPKIMLVKGVLGQPLSGFSSFQSMDEDLKYVAPVVAIIEALKPDVMLVEKSVSRDIQLSILDKGVTLMLDMKLHRLERISRCIGSPIISLDSLSSQKLKHCDSFRIEKIVEEHNAVGESEKKPSKKTLMFLEGCPTRLGCTILLKGSHSDRLKKVKEVVQGSVILAYHLILEASFLADRQTMFSTIFPKEATSCVTTETENFPLSLSPRQATFAAIDTPLTNGFSDQSIELNGDTDGDKAGTWESGGDHVFSHEPYNPVIFTGFSTLSAKLSKYLGFVQNPESVPVSVDTDVLNIINLDSIEESTDDTAEKDETKQSLLLDPGLPVNTNSDDGDRSQTENDVETTLDSQSILVLVSKRNALRGVMCDQSHFSHIKFYNHFDVPLEIFLRLMFSQRSRCQTCDELPEAHLYYYAHHNKQLTIQIKRIPVTKRLSGEEKGKIWMWSRCGKCKTKNTTRRSTKRVLISTAARSLSFGKFLELSFTQQTFLNSLCSCGHSVDRDFLHFFGLGSMVAMLSYSQVTSYTVSLPPMKLEASIIIKVGWLEDEFRRVFTKGISLFEDAASFLKRLRPQFTNSDISYQRTLKLLSTIEELLKHERCWFQENINISFDKATTIDDVSHKLLRLNRMRWELLLLALIWNYRLQSLFSSDRLLPSCGDNKTNEEGSETVSDAGMTRYKNIDKASDSGSNGGMEVPPIESKEIPIVSASIGDNDQMEDSVASEDNNELQNLSSSSPDTTSQVDSHFDTHLAVNIHSTNEQEVEKSIPVTGDSLDDEVTASNGPQIFGWDEWFWQRFEDLRSKRIAHVEKEYLLKFEYVNNLTQENLQTVNQIITEEGSRLRISLRDDDFIVSDYEDELSSLIACAIAILNNAENRMPLSRSIHGSLEGFIDKDQDSKQTIDRELSRYSSEITSRSTSRLDVLPPPEVVVTFGSIKSVGKPKYSVVCLYADDFRDLRKRCCSSELDYIASLSRCKPWDAQGGKSKSVFAKTLDDRFIVKEIKKTEYESFVKFAPEYFKYMKDSYELGNQTCLAKVLGIHQVTVRQPKSGKEIRHDLMVMENLSFGRKITRQYDLKGALHARFTNTSANGAEDVLLDQNFVNDMNQSPLYVSKTSKQNLQRAVYNDTSFLTSINVMDYSLLVGVDDERHELVCGIIDYLRQYTWDKQLETWVKSSLVVPKNVQPTVISPIDYKTRFRKFMKTHFLCVPDQWCIKQEQTPLEDKKSKA